MKRVTGIGGIFFKAREPERVKDWYEQHPGLDSGNDTAVVFSWRERDENGQPGTTTWSIFPHDTKYFEPGTSPFMVNYPVENLKQVLTQLRAEGVTVKDGIHVSEYGRFGWIVDPEGNAIELWEPPPGM